MLSVCMTAARLQIDHRRYLPSGLNGTRFGFELVQGFSPGQHTASSISASRTKVRPEQAQAGLVAIGHKKRSRHPPHGLDEARCRGILLNELAQPRHLHVQASVEGLEVAAAGQLRQFFARQGWRGCRTSALSMANSPVVQAEFFVVLAQDARSKVKAERTESDGFIVGRR